MNSQPATRNPLPATRHLIWPCLLTLLLPQVRQFFFYQGWRWAFILLFSLLLSHGLTPLVRNLAIRFGVLDQPNPRKVHKAPTPLLGGLAIYLAFIAALLVNNVLSASMTVILAAATIIVLVSAVDDACSLSAQLKLAVQVLAVVLVWRAGIRIEIFPRFGVGEAAVIAGHAGNAALTFLWIVGITNAMNFLDGTDGLATGLGVVISFFLGLVAMQTGQADLGWCALAMLGACLGFLPYNFRRQGPALIFLGDTGSTFIGFTLACLAIEGDWSQSSPLVSICTPIIIFGVLIFDMVHTTVARIYTGKVRNFHEWVSYTGKDHIHHRLHRLFQSNKKTVCLILAISGCLGLSAIVLRQADTVSSLLVVCQAALGFIMFSALNFYQEKTILKIEKSRSGFRVQESFDVVVSLAGDEVQLDGMVIDISEHGARVLVPAGTPLKLGADIVLGAAAFSDAAIEPPQGRVIRKREIMVGEERDRYVECGVRFSNSNEQNILKLLCWLHRNQLARRQNALRLDPVTIEAM